MTYPYQPTTIGPLDTAEVKTVYFSFAREVASGTNLTSATVEIDVISGIDTDPNGMKVGDATIDNTLKLVAQQLTGANRNHNTYNVRCIAPDSLGNTNVVAAILPVVFLVTD